MHRLIITVSGPSGSGKTTLLQAAIAEINSKVGTYMKVKQVPSLTTRTLRSNEQGRVYVDIEEFNRQKEHLIESIVFNGHAYGISKTLINDTLNDGFIAILDADPSGVNQILAANLDAEIRPVFIVARAHEIASRLLPRSDGLDKDSKIWRLRRSLCEIEAIRNPVFRVLENKDLATAVHQLIHIIEEDPPDDNSFDADAFINQFKREMAQILVDLNDEGVEEHD